MKEIDPVDILDRATKLAGSVACGTGAYFFYAAGTITGNPKWLALSAGCGASMVYMATEAFTIKRKKAK